MEDKAYRAIAIVGAGAVMPDASNVADFWQNIKTGRNCISEVPRDRWNPAFHYDADHSAPDKTYSTIGGWVREFPWEPMKWRLPLPPRVTQAMDESQQWALACTREALQDYGYPERPLDADRTAVILGNALGGEKHYLTALRVFFPEYAQQLEECPTFAGLPKAMQADIARELRGRVGKLLPTITEDSMPGELANCVAGRIANIFNFHGPNFTTDAACASTMAGLSAAANGLIQHDFDVAISGGIDRNMGISSYVKFCKIGALSATGSRPYAEGADGFVMGEGAAIFVLKRLADAERDGDKIYAVLRGIGGSSDGKGKGITAPNPIGQKFAIERAWENAGLSPATATLMEGHGTSTRVGDAVEVQSMKSVLGSFNLPAASVALGSVKSNIGHLKGAAAAAATLKVAMSLHEKVLPPSVNCPRANPELDLDHSPLYVNTELRPWTVPQDGVRRAGLSAFGFGGTNFHMVMEEYIPGRLNGNGKHSISVGAIPGTMNYTGAGVAKAESSAQASVPGYAEASASRKAPLRGALVIGAESLTAIAERLGKVQQAAAAGQAPALAAPEEAELRAPERLSIDYGDAAELAEKASKALKALAANQPAIWKMLRAQGIFLGHGPAPKVAFLYTGQGSQYVNMIQALRAAEPIVADTFAEADRVLTPLIGKPLSEFIFINGNDATAVAQAENDLRQTAITQPAVIATDVAMTRLLGAYGIRPDMAMGHSVGEYGALVVSGALPFDDAMEAVSARGREMTNVALGDNGGMVAVFAPLEQIEKTLKTIDGYVVIANVNSKGQAVIGGESKPIKEATEAFLKAGFNAVPLPVSHAFHTSIVAGASEPLKRMLERLRLRPPVIPIIANINGEFYPMGPDAKTQMVEMLAKQVASPVQFVKGLETLYEAGARVFIEAGPKKALQGFAEDVLGERGDVLSLFTNHPKLGDVVAFNQALCGLYASGLGGAAVDTVEIQIPAPQTAEVETAKVEIAEAKTVAIETGVVEIAEVETVPEVITEASQPVLSMAATFVEPAQQVPPESAAKAEQDDVTYSGKASVVISGAGLGLPGTEHIFDETNISRILGGEQFIDAIPKHLRRAMLDKRITRLVKNDNGGGFETIDKVENVIKLAGRGGAFDIESEFGVSADRTAALDRVTALAMASGIDALRDAGIPLVMRYKTTTIGTQLSDRWMLPESLRDDTGIVFASVWPGMNSFVDELTRYHADQNRREQLAMLESLQARAAEANGNSVLGQEIEGRIQQLRSAIETNPYLFNRRFIFRVLSMGHSQFAEFIGARGPNTHVNAACASTAQAVAIAEDWIQAGRCRRVVVISADDITSDHLIEWMGAGFLASGAAATDEHVEDAAIPFDRRRHGMIMGMGAAALVVESADAAKERGIRPICEVLSTVTANSAFHGTRLDVKHICQLMEDLVAKAETRKGVFRHQIAPKMVFVSHETYTPARGGSAAAEISALRHVFGESADQIVIANTKGFTGHAMGTGIEDVVAVKALETGCVPPVANFKEIDPELGPLNLSKGGSYPIEYALRLGAGFGSQISMTLMRWVATKDGLRPRQDELGYDYRIVDAAAWKNWLAQVSGTPSATLEVVQHTLRVCDVRASARVAAAAANSQLAFSSRLTAQPAPGTPLAATQPEPVSQLSNVAESSLKVRAAAVSASASPAPILTEEPVKELIPKSAPRETEASNIELSRPELDGAISLSPITSVPELQSAVTVQPDADGLVKEESMELAVKEKVLEIVAEKTGYPKDMLDLDLDLEADLGVDTVKQAEMFAAVRAAYNIPRDENIKLRDFPTLSHVINFAISNQAALVAPATPVKAEAPAAPVKPAPTPAPAAVAAAPAVAVSVEAIKEKVLEIVAEKTGYPKDMLDLDLDLEADLGVDTVKQAEMFAAVRAAYNIPRNENIKLRDFPTLSHVINFAISNQAALAAAAPAAPVKAEAPAPTPAPAVVAAAPAVAVSVEAIKEKVLEIVAEKTGYPKDMLDLDLDLEADLGVDTVKQAEMFAAVRAAYNIPRDENIKLRDFPTLSHVINFAISNQAALAAAAPAAPVKAEAPAPAPAPAAVAAAPAVAVSVEAIREKVLEIVAEKTGYPKDMLDLDLDLEADLGVDTVKQAEMFAAVRAAYNIPRNENIKLRDFPTLSHVINFAISNQAALAAAALAAPVKAEAPAPTPAPAVAVTPTVAAAPAVAVSVEAIKEKVLEIVAEKTGYPKDMLDLDLDLEADLGVDTVKQAEMFAAVRAAYNIPRDENIKLRDFPTLSHVINFAISSQAALVAPAAPAAPVKAEAPAPAPAPVAVAAAPAVAVSVEAIKEKVLEIVAEKTGYPKDMLDLDLDLEADLGVDTVKQAEMFAAVRAAYNIPRNENIKLRDFPTLSHVINFAISSQTAQVVAAPAAPVKAEAPAPAPAAKKPPQSVSAPMPAARPRPALASLDAANSIPRRVPVPVLRPSLTICKPTGVTLGAGSRVVLMPDKGGVADALTKQLQSMGVEVLRIEGAPDADTLINCIKNWTASGPVQGVYWLTALDHVRSLLSIDLPAWREALRVRVKLLYTAMRALYDQIAAPGTFLVSATLLGGQHGYDEAGAIAPLGGSVVGMTKTYKRERADVTVKAVDFELGYEASELANVLVEETLRDPGAVEVGYKEGERWTVGLQEQPAADGQPGLSLDPNSVFVVTGAAGGIVSAITADLAAASGGTFYLLDLVPEPDPNNPDLARFLTDRDGLKRELFGRIQARGERATPALVERELAGLERAQAALKAINAVREAGGTAHYFSVNLTDGDAVAKVIEQVRQRSGRIDVLLHAAGMERSHFLPDKDPREFDLIFDVKSDGWFNLLRAIGDMPLGATVAFSSIAGRFGNGGQADYSSANDLLCKITSSFRTTRPATRGIVIDWTAWGGIGMATRGSIPKMMELAGIDMLPPEAGVPLIRRELTAGATRGEIVVAQRLGILVQEFDAAGGLDLAAVEKLSPAHGPMIGKVISLGIHSGLTIETTLDPALQPFLHDHQIGGTPVLPGVMGIEAFAEAAQVMLPGWHVETVEGINFLAPFKFYRNQPRTLTIKAIISQKGDDVVAECRLIGHRMLPNKTEPEETTHFTAQVRLTKQVAENAAAKGFPKANGSTFKAADIYRIYFHGPAYRVLGRAWREGNCIVGELAKDLPNHHQPSGLQTLLAPRLIELCFQTAGLWEIAQESRMGLPQHVGRVCWLRAPESAKDQLYAVVTPHPEQASFDAEVVDASGNLYLQVSGYRTVALPDSIDRKLLTALTEHEPNLAAAD